DITVSVRSEDGVDVRAGPLDPEAAVCEGIGEKNVVVVRGRAKMRRDERNDEAREARQERAPHRTTCTMVSLVCGKVLVTNPLSSNGTFETTKIGRSRNHRK